MAYDTLRNTEGLLPRIVSFPEDFLIDIRVYTSIRSASLPAGDFIHFGVSAAGGGNQFLLRDTVAPGREAPDSCLSVSRPGRL